MRTLLMLSAAASVLALGISTQQAATLFPGTTATGSGAFVQKIQQKAEEKGSGGAQVRIPGRALAAARLAARHKIKATQADMRNRVKRGRMVGSVAAPMSM